MQGAGVAPRVAFDTGHADTRGGGCEIRATFPGEPVLL